MMMFGGGISYLVTPAGPAADAMGAIVIGLLVLTALVLLVAPCRRSS